MYTETVDVKKFTNLSKPLSKDKIEFINNFSKTRRFKRNSDVLMIHYNGKYGFPNPKEKTAKGYYGTHGEYFVKTNCSMFNDGSVIDYNTPSGQLSFGTPSTTVQQVIQKNKARIENGLCCPDLNCEWQVNEDGTTMYWTEPTNTKNKQLWLDYIKKHFLSAWNVEFIE